MEMLRLVHHAETLCVFVLTLLEVVSLLSCVPSLFPG